jgi:hypothetical protein
LTGLARVVAPDAPDGVRDHRSRTNRNQRLQTSTGIPLTTTEPAAKLVIGAPLAEPLASRGVVVIPYCAENMHIAPVFGPGALTVSPRVGHVHVTVDASPWRWADASGTPTILQGLPPEPHTVLIELVNANHEVVDKDTVRFDVPSKAAAQR